MLYFLQEKPVLVQNRLKLFSKPILLSHLLE